ncbi:MAG: GAF domain-containing protein [Chloroflexi bacterium]|nr:GAF domain-containing protein [Chloroflexota bacterium]
MPKNENTSPIYFQILVLTLSIVSLILGTILSPPSLNEFIPFLILVVFIALLEFTPLDLLNYRYSLVHIVVFSGGILYGTGLVAWACVLGIGAAIGLQLVFPLRLRPYSSSVKPTFFGGLFELGHNLVSLVFALSVFGIAKGISSIEVGTNQNWLAILGAGLLFGAIHGSIYIISTRFLASQQTPRARWDYLALISIEILPVYLGFTTLLTYPFLKNGSLIVLGVSTFALGLLIHYLSAPRRNLERRLQELSALEEISKALSSDIDLEKLLSAIQVQVTNLLNVDNFYVALLDPVDQQIWYPLAVKNGTRQNWPRRPLTDRLTDRVILESNSILIPHHAAQQLTKIGLPSGEDAPFAWIGVPLITSEQSIGCLALFSLTSEVEFSQDDLNLLTILSGQTSVAIEISLHNALLSSDITIGRDRLTTILNSVRDGLILIDTDGKITLINEAVTRLSGIPQSEFIGHVLKDLPTDVIETIGFTIQEAGELLERINLDEVPEFNKQSYTKVNRVQELVIERSLIPVDGESDQLAGLIILLRDITDEYKIKQAQDLISETLVHDLRSPLSSTISALDVIHDSFLSGDPAGIVEPSIQIAQRSSRRMLAMVESILEITRMESGNIELSLSKVNIETLLEDSVSEFTTVALEYEVSISVKYPSDLPTVRMDKNKIHRVINNLIDNALKYTPKNGEILITAGINNQELLEIRVIDSGPGIPKEYQKRIFERFAQIPGMPSRKRGSGLGLTYCRLAIEAHGGEIWVDDNPGGGSTFIFTLPVAGPDEQGD